MTIALSEVGFDVGVPRATLAFVVLTFVPGFLVLRIAGISPGSYATGIAYTVGTSLAVLMGLGAAFNFLYQVLGVGNPLFLVPETIGITLVGLTGAYYVLVEESHTVRIRLQRVFDPPVLGLALLPFLAVFGALLLTRYGQNELLLVLYGVLALLPFAVVSGRVPDRLLSYAIWVVSISLLLQNALTGQYLAWGDQPKEATLALHVLQQGHWDPALAPGFGNKYAMLRIVVLHPIHALFTDLHLVWVFKLVHPLLFSLAPVALYEAYANYFDERVAFLSAYLFVSLFSFFVVLSRNTRTATAILFLAFVVLALADDDLEHVHAKGLGILFVTAIAVSHYGVSYMVLLALVLVLPLTRLIEALTGASARRLTSPAFVLLYFAFTLSWYMYLSPRSKAFNTLIGFGDHFTSTLVNQFLTSPESTSSTTRYVAADFSSIVLRLLTVYNLLVGGIIVAGVATSFWIFYRRGDTYDAEFLAYAAVFLGVFAITFLPVERFNTARTYPTTLLFFAPFFVEGVKRLSLFATRVIGLDLDSDRIPVRRIATVLIVGYFVLNVGLVSATVAHQYSPNVLVEKDRVVDGGHPEERTYFHKQYPTAYGVTGSQWIHSHAAVNSTVYSSTWPGGMRGAVGYDSWEGTSPREVQLERRPLPSEGRVGSGFVYLNAFSHHRVGNVIRYPAGHFEFNWQYTSQVMAQWSHKDRVYSNGGSTIYR